MLRFPSGRSAGRLAPGILMVSAATLSMVAARRLELLERLPENATPYFLAFGLTFLLSLIAGRVTPAAPAAVVVAPAASPLTGRARYLRGAAAIGALVLFGWAWTLQGRRAFPLPTLAVWASALALGAVAFAVPGRRTVRGPQGRTSPGVVVAIVLVLIAAARARLVGLEAVPPVLSGDDASQVMYGASLIRGGLRVDPFGTGWVGTGVLGMMPAGAGALLWKDPIAGPKLPYAIAGTLSVVACTAAAALLAGGWAALGCAALFAFCPFQVFLSRLTSVYCLDALFAALAAFFLFAADRFGSPLCGYLAGLSAGLSLYGYAGGRVIAVAFLLSLPLLFFLSRSSLQARGWILLSLAVGFALTAAPGLRFAFHHYSDWNSRFNQVGIFNPGWWDSQVHRVGSPMRVLWDQFRASTIGLLCMRSSGGFLGYPILAPILPALSAVGLGWTVGRRRFFPAALLALIVLGNLANLMLTVAAPAAPRSSSLVPMLTILGGAAIAGFLELLPSRDRRGTPWRGMAGTLLIGGVLAQTYGGPPGFWDPSPGYGGGAAAFAQSACQILRAPRYRGEPVFLHGRSQLDSSFPSFSYFLPRTHFVDVEEGQREPLPPASRLHLFFGDWTSADDEWRIRHRIPRGIGVPDPGDPRHDVGLLLVLPEQKAVRYEVPR